MSLNIPYTYKVTAKAEKSGDYLISSDNLETLKTAPPQNFGGPGNLWSPEDLFVAAVVDCFLMTFKAVSHLSKLDWISLNCNAEGKIERIDSKIQFTEITINAVLELDNNSKEERALRILEKAEDNCLVSNSLKTKVTLNSIIKIK